MRIPCGLTQYLAPCLGGADAIKYRGLLPAGCYWCYVNPGDRGDGGEDHLGVPYSVLPQAAPNPETQSISVRLKPLQKVAHLGDEDSHIANS